MGAASTAAQRIASIRREGKRVSAADAVRLIRDRDTVASSGFVGHRLRRKPGSGAGAALPRNAGAARPHPGLRRRSGRRRERGLNHLGHEGLVARVIGGHWGLVPKLQKLAVENRIEAWNLPQGVISHLFRDIAAGRPGQLTRVGLGYLRRSAPWRRQAQRAHHRRARAPDAHRRRGFPVLPDLPDGRGPDPRHHGRSRRQPHHGARSVDAGALAIAMAAHNSGGIVIAQVERLAEAVRLQPRQVKVPGVLVDCVVLAEIAPSCTRRPSPNPIDPAFAGRLRVPAGRPSRRCPLSPRKVMARRAALELRPNAVVNLGIGMPEGVAAVAAEESVIDLITLTTEPGVLGGIPGRRTELRRGGQHAGGDRPALPVRSLRWWRPGSRGAGPGAGR
jgi:propionate CoA-transferase